MCTIAGFDPTGGAGIDADLRTFAAHAARGEAVRTATTEQDGTGVQALHPLPPAAVGRAVRGVLADHDPAGVKTGMLATGATVAAVAEALAGAPARPLVVDPVIWAGAGGRLLDEQGVAALHGRLGALATLLTPNLPEAAQLLGCPIPDADAADRAARALLDCGWRAVLLKGGHAATGGEVVDRLATPAGLRRFVRPRIGGATVRGTGCTLAAALTARLASGQELAPAVAAAGDWLHALLSRARRDGAVHLDPAAVPPTPTPGTLPPLVPWE